jgi:predicted phage terminase large subunit-like protein
MRRAWHVIETAPFIDGWHLRLMCSYLERAYRGEITKLIINIPPGCSKSGTVSVFGPVWMWIQRPDLRFMYSSHDISLALRDSNRTKELITSQWFLDRWGDLVSLDKRKVKADTGTEYYTTAGGLRFSSTVAGRGVGWHSHVQAVDDPLKPADAAITTGAMIERANEWWRNTMSTRKADPKYFVRIIIMQRLHTRDLSGVCLEEGGWTHLCLPMEYDPNHEYLCEEDPRTEPGELLCSERFDGPAVQELKKALGPDLSAAQLEQRPVPAGGSVFHTGWLEHFWVRLPDRDLVWAISWDHTFGSLKKGASFVVGQVWVFCRADSYLVHQVRDRMEFPEMISAMRELREMFPQALKQYVEAKAAGPAIEQSLRREIPGIVMVKADRSTGGKLARAQSVTGLFSAGNVHFPHPTKARLQGIAHPSPWVSDMIKRFKLFTGSDADIADEIDACTQVLMQQHGSGAARFRQAMSKARGKR